MAEQKRKEWWQQPRWWAIGVGVLVALILTDVVAAFALPPRIASHIGTASAADQLKAEADLRSAILSLLGALTPLVALIAGIAALLNFQETRRQNVASLEVTRRGQVTDRFTKAIEQLGQSDDEKLDTRLGAIYGLEQIAKDSEDLHWPVMQILTAYLREHSTAGPGKKGKEESDRGAEADQDTPRARADYLAVADVIRRRRSEWDSEPLNLEHCDLRRSDLQKADLNSANFERAQLDGANFEEAQLDEANFKAAQLTRANFKAAQLARANFEAAELARANFWRAQLQGANFGRAQLEWTDFWLAQLQGADFLRAQLEGAAFREAQLQGAYFEAAELKEAEFVRAQLKGVYFGEAKLKAVHFDEAQLNGAHLEGVDLRQTEGLVQHQLDSANCDETTKPPPGLTITDCQRSPKTGQ